MLHKPVASIFLLLAFAHSTLGIITGFQAPNGVLHPGNPFTVTFTTENHIIQNAQYYVVFGLHSGTTPPPGTNVGETLLTSSGSDLVETHHSSTGHGSFKVKVNLPKSFHTGSKHNSKWSLTAAILQTAGALNGAGVVDFHDVVTIAPH